MHSISDTFVARLQQSGCGYTLDCFTSPAGESFVQWVWASPLGSDATAFAERIERELNARLESESPRGSVELALDRAVARVENCPFQPSACPGEHVVATGAGRVRSAS